MDLIHAETLTCIKKILDSFSFEVPEIEINTTNVNEVEDEKEEKNDTR